MNLISWQANFNNIIEKLREDCAFQGERKNPSVSTHNPHHPQEAFASVHEQYTGRHTLEKEQHDLEPKT